MDLRSIYHATITAIGSLALRSVLYLGGDDALRHSLSAECDTLRAENRGFQPPRLLCLQGSARRLLAVAQIFPVRKEVFGCPAIALNTIVWQKVKVMTGEACYAEVETMLCAIASLPSATQCDWTVQAFSPHASSICPKAPVLPRIYQSKQKYLGPIITMVS